MTTQLGRRLGGLITRRRVAIYSAIVLAVVVGEYLIIYATGNGVLDRFGQVKGTDFVQFYVAGQLIAAGQGSQLYSFVPPFQFPAQFAAEAKVLSPQVSSPNFAFVVPAYFGFLFVPLSYLPYQTAFGVWIALNLCLLVAILRLLRPYVGLLRGPDRRIAYLVVVSYFPFLECLFDGQNAIVSLFLLTASYVALRRRWEVWAGVALGLALYKPQFVVVLALLLLIAGYWKTVLSLVVTGVTLITASLAAVGIQGMIDYLRLSATMPGWVFIPDWRTWNMHSWYSFFVLLVRDPTASRLLTAFVTLGTFAFLVHAWRRVGVEKVNRFNSQFSLAIVGTTLISPHVFAYDLTVLILPGLLLTARTLANPGERGHWLAGWPRVLWVVGYFIPLFSRFSAIAIGLQLSVLVIAGIFIATWLALDRMQSGDLELDSNT